MKRTLVIAGGGAAGIFAAVNAALLDPALRVVVLEKSAKLLAKVKISGGGRCNVTHSCFDPTALTAFYPRGARELKGPFHRFQPADTVEWFLSRGIRLKTESDGRMFPVTDSSQTIIDCLMHEASRLNVEIFLQQGLQDFIQSDDGKGFDIHTTTGEHIAADYLLITTGSTLSIWEMLERHGHRIIEPVPSLFTFNISDDRIAELPGLSVPDAVVKLEGSKLATQGPLLITHWGLSGPAILRMSAIAARELAEMNYHFSISVSWIGLVKAGQLEEELYSWRKSAAIRVVRSQSIHDLPSRLWQALLPESILNKKWADLSNQDIRLITGVLLHCKFEVTGKSTFKEEFVTAGGVDLREVDFRTMESKIVPGLYFAGEVLNIDAVTGGFNFQAAWTTGHIAAETIANPGNFH